MADQTILPPDLKARLKASYDAIAPKYNEWTASHSTTRLHYLGLLLGRLPASTASRPVAVLEIGCGHGVPVTQVLLSQPSFTVTANDLSSAQIALARASLQAEAANGRLTLIEGDMLALDFAPGSFDAVVGMYSHSPAARRAGGDAGQDRIVAAAGRMDAGELWGGGVGGVGGKEMARGGRGVDVLERLGARGVLGEGEGGRTGGRRGGDDGRC